MNISYAILLGILQGLTEFLPISSSAHLVIVQSYIKDFHQPGALFDITLHFGTLLAIFIYFRKEIKNILFNNRKVIILIVIGSIPTGIIGLLLKDYAEILFSSLSLSSLMLIVTGILLYIASKFNNNGKKEIRKSDAILIGVIQGLSVIPGISRSGSTISVGIYRGIKAEHAAEFSFLLSIPAVLGANILSMRDFVLLSGTEVSYYIIGMLTSFLSGLIGLHFLMKFINRLNYFSYYCFAIGGINLIEAFKI
jgi:undecaprenyl-diphosphatase